LRRQRGGFFICGEQISIARHTPADETRFGSGNNRIMKIKIIQLVVLTSIYICASFSAHCQTNSNGLAIVNVLAGFASESDPNRVKLDLYVYVLNTTNHDITILTKSLVPGLIFRGIPEETHSTNALCEIGLSDSFNNTYQGHAIIPSLSDMAPVTLRSNEVGIVILHYPNMNKSIATTNMQMTVKYSIAPNWGSRFGAWTGSIESQPYKVDVSRVR
jgi:hypothetical protein